MKKVLITILNFFAFAICVNIAFAVNVEAKEENMEITQYESEVIEESNIGRNAKLKDYDFATYDIYGKEYFYNYDDFDYREDYEFERYDYSMRNVDEINTDGRNIDLRDDDDDDDDPFAIYYYMPYSAVCVIYTSYDTNNDGLTDVTYIGSGSLVGPDVVLTAEENTYNSAYGYPTNLVVVPGEYTNENGALVKPYGESSFYSITRGNYHTTFDANDNWAIIRISSSLGYNAGWFDVEESGLSNGSTVSTYGYTYINNNYAIADYLGIVSNLQTYKFYHNDLQPTTSNGAPIVGYNTYTIYGIQCGTRVIVNNVQYSQACKISIYIKNWVREAGGGLELRIYSDLSVQTSSGGPLGHAFLTIKNNTPWYITIGKKFVSPNSSISVGTWPNGYFGHNGIHYNVEHHYYMQGDFTNHVSYKRNIFVSQWNLANSYFLYLDDWSYMINCVYFATHVWNYILPQYSFDCAYIPVPLDLYNQITSCDGYETNHYIEGTDEVGYYNGNVFVNIT